MLLGIVYHASLSLALDFPWMVQDRSASQWMYMFQAFVHGFRMPLFFVISGFFTAMLWRSKGLKALLWHRFRRVFIPCLLGLFTVIPVMNATFQYAFRSEIASQSLERTPGNSNSNIWVAIQKGDEIGLHFQIGKGAKLDELHPQFGTNALTWAALNNHMKISEMLIASGAEINGRNQDGGTALHAAAFLGRSEIVSMLLDKGANVNALNYRSESPLHNAQVDYGAAEYIASLLQIPIVKEDVLKGREKTIEILKQNGGIDETTPQQARPQTQSMAQGVYVFLKEVDILAYLWFLWLLWLYVVLFAVASSLFGWIGKIDRVKRFVRSPAALLLLIPVTMAPQWMMSSGAWEFGPDTSMRFIPLTHVFVYYAIFFAYGVLYFDADDQAGQIGLSWRWTLPLMMLVVLPLAVEFATGRFGWRNSLLPSSYHRWAAVLMQAVYAWGMTFGMMGMFRSLLTKEDSRIRYMSDASYWLYLAHLPLIVIGQVIVRNWQIPAVFKLAIVSVVVTAMLIVSYELFVRYTPLGTLLNGKRTRKRKALGVGSAGTQSVS